MDFGIFRQCLPHSFEDGDRRTNGETNHGRGQEAVQITEKHLAVSQLTQYKRQYYRREHREQADYRSAFLVFALQDHIVPHSCHSHSKSGNKV